MDIKSEKYHIIQQIVNLQDRSVISKIKDLLNTKTSSDWYDELTSSQKKDIKKSLKQANKGDTIPHSAVQKQIKEKIQSLKDL